MRATHSSRNESYIIFTPEGVTEGFVLEGRVSRGREGLTFTFNFRGHLVDYSLLALRLNQLNSTTLI